jgi:hypothetical protein
LKRSLRSGTEAASTAVWSISGMAPSSVSHASSVLMACACVAGTTVYSAYPPLKSRDIKDYAAQRVNFERGLLRLRHAELAAGAARTTARTTSWSVGVG